MRRFLLYFPLFLNGILLQGQNYVVNPGFESYSLCPTGLNFFNGYVNNWAAANMATPDYVNCGISGTPVVTVTPATGTGAAGIWGAPSHSSCAGSAYVENITAPLTAALTPGFTYQVSFTVRVDAVGSASAPPNNCLDFGVYFFQSSNPLPGPGLCCFPVNPHFAVPGSFVPDGTYTTFTGNVTATAGWDRIVVGAFCNVSTGSAGCSNHTGVRNYFNVDDVSVTPIVLAHSGLSLTAKPFDGFTQISWQCNTGEAGCRLELLKGNDPREMHSVQSWLPTGFPAQESWPDLQPGAAGDYYRLMLVHPDGDSEFSEIAFAATGAAPATASLSESNQQVCFEPRAEGEWRFMLTDASGKWVLDQTHSLNEGETYCGAVGGNLAAGIYFWQMRELHSSMQYGGKLIAR